MRWRRLLLQLTVMASGDVLRSGVFKRGDAISRLVGRRRAAHPGVWCRTPRLSGWNLSRLDAAAGHGMQHAETTRPRHARPAHCVRRQMSRRIRCCVSSVGGKRWTVSTCIHESSSKLAVTQWRILVVLPGSCELLHGV